MTRRRSPWLGYCSLAELSRNCRILLEHIRAATGAKSCLNVAGVGPPPAPEREIDSFV